MDVRDEGAEPAEDVVEARPRAPLSRRTRLVVLGVLVLVVVTALTIDLRLRRAGERATADCAADVEAAARSATGTVTAMAAYVRPTAFVAEPRLREELYDLVAQEAVGASDGLRPVRARCADVWLLWSHQELRARRSACVERLDRLAEHLDAVAADGRTQFVSAPEPVSGC